MGKFDIGQALSGAAEVAVSAVEDNRRAKIQAMRDAKLQEYAQQNLKTQQTFQADQGILMRQLQKDLQTERLGAQERQHQENLGMEEKRLDATLEYQGMQYMANEAERKDRLKLLEAQIAETNLSKDLKALDLKDRQQMQKALDTILKSDATPEQKQQAIEYINLRSPETSGRKIVVKQLEDMMGPIDDFAVIEVTTGPGNQATARRLPLMSLPLAGGGSGQHTRANPAKIQSVDDYNKLQPGDWYVHPGNGQLYQVPATPQPPPK